MPFGFLYAGMDYAVHAQFGEHLNWGMEWKRLINIIPTIYILNIMTLWSPPPIPTQLLQFLLAVLSLGTGSSLIKLTTTESYLAVMRKAPALGVLWVWSVVRLDLAWALGALGGVLAIVKWRGDKGVPWIS
ncbi:hypothetical protein T439DRAFT_325462 [Meredithblackwellia eburnea MCA 4105]